MTKWIHATPTASSPEPLFFSLSIKGACHCLSLFPFIHPVIYPSPGPQMSAFQPYISHYFSQTNMTFMYLLRHRWKQQICQHSSNAILCSSHSICALSLSLTSVILEAPKKRYDICVCWVLVFAEDPWGGAEDSLDFGQVHFFCSFHQVNKPKQELSSFNKQTNKKQRIIMYVYVM